MLVTGTAEADIRRSAYITDLKVVTGPASVDFVLKTASSDISKPLKFKFPANYAADFKWNVPYKLTIVSSTGETKAVLASVAAGYKYSISGYTEKE
jgi:hypothetical protein